jgi:hypothetical protein
MDKGHFGAHSTKYWDKEHCMIYQLELQMLCVMKQL